LSGARRGPFVRALEERDVGARHVGFVDEPGQAALGIHDRELAGDTRLVFGAD